MTDTPSQPAGTKPRFLWLEYAILLAIGVVGYEIKKPFGLLLHQIMGIKDIPPHSIIDLARNQAVQIVVVAALASIVHRYTALPAAPSLERLLYGMHADRKLRIWLHGLLGLVAILIVVGGVRAAGAHFGFVAPLATKLGFGGLTPAIAHKLTLLAPAAAIGAALSEEVLFRFGLLTIFAWAFLRLLPASERARHIAFGIAIVLQALAFGYVHVAEGMMQLPVGGTAFQVLIAPETWAGIVFGYVFVRYGLEAAIIAHASADLINLSLFVMMALGRIHS